jgi:outer membrane receptor protein involved in Fe transport
LCIILAALALAVTAFGQRETGQITGVITDSSGAVVPNARITVTNPATGVVVRKVETTSSGLYTVTNLLPAAYEVKVEAQGFQTAVIRTTVTVASSLEANATLKVASAGSQTVEVTATDVVQVDTQSQSLSTNVSEKQITDLPTISRNPYDLVATAGNVSDASQANDNRGAGGVAINGQRSASTDILLDGGENVDLFRASVGQNVPLDSVQEFTVTTSAFTAEMGRASGGVINVVTKSGTNTMHGSAYEFYRGAGLTSNTYNNAVFKVAKPNFVRNQFGYSVGGPIIKNKLFFFNNTEWLRVRSKAARTVLVPDPSFIALTGQATRDYFAKYGSTIANAVPTVTAGDLRNPASPYSMGAGTLPLVPNAQAVFDQVSYTYPSDSGGGSPQNQYQIVGRADWNLSDKTQIYGRYASQNISYFAGSVADSPYDGYNTGEAVKNYNFAFSATHTFVPTLVSQSKIIFNRLNDSQPLGPRPAGPTLYTNPTSYSVLNGRRITFPGYLPWSPGSGIPFGGPQNLYQLYQDVNWVKGRHQWRFGGQYVHTRDNRTFGAYENPVEALQAAENLSAAMNFLYAGNISQFSSAVDPQGKYPCYNIPGVGVQQNAGCTVNLPVTTPRFSRNNRYHDFAFYGQDSWKMTDRLTINLGLRWEYYGVQHNADPKLDSNFYYGSGSNLYQQIRNGSMQIAEKSPVGGLWAQSWNNFAPRVGFAWDIFGDGKTSLRGGYGISYERNFGNVTFNVIQNPPNYAVINLTPTDISQPTMPIYVDTAGPLTGSGSKALPGTSTRNVSPDIKTGYAQSWSGALEREVMRNTIVSIEYSGSKGANLYSIENVNRRGAGNLYAGDPIALGRTRLNYQYTSMNNRADRGFSIYHGLNVGLRSNNLHNTGLSVTANYTWSHAIDNLSTTFSSFSNNFNLGLLDPFNPGLDRGNADFDQRQRIVLSAIWNMPWMKNSTNVFAKHILGGWQVAPIFHAATGSPYTIWDSTRAQDATPRWVPAGPYSREPNGNGQDSGGNNFPWLTLPASAVVPGNYVNTVLGVSNFGQCGIGQGATGICPFPANMTPRNAFLGPGSWNINFAVYKNFNITEKVSFQFRSEFYDLTNHKNLAMYGSAANVRNNHTTMYAYKLDDRRAVQFGGKIIF